MTPASIYLGAVLAAALVVFYKGWLRTDVTAFLVMLSLMVPWQPAPGGGLQPILSVNQALSGFGSPAVIMVASMFLLSGAMVHAGGAHLLGGWILGRGARTEPLFQITVLTVVTFFSAFVNDTTTVLIWMPLVLAVCRERGYSPSRFLLPLAYASLLGGQWTLIGTRSNIIVSDYLAGRSGEGLGFFSFTPIAIAVWGACLAYFILVGRRLLPATAAEPSLAQRYDVTEYLTEVMATPSSEFVGRSLEELDLPGRFDVKLLQIIRGNEHIPPSPWVRVFPADVFVVQGSVSRITEFLQRSGLKVQEELKVGDSTLRSVDLRMVEAIVAPNSEFIGRRLDEIEFTRRYGGVSVLAVGRHGHPLEGRPLSHKLQFGDALLLIGHESEIRPLRDDPNVLLLESRPYPSAGGIKSYITIGLLALVAVTAATKVFEPGFVIPLAAVLAVLTRCIGMRQAYESLDLRSLVTVGAMIPFGLALEKTGTAEIIGQHVAATLDPLGSYAVLAALLLCTVLLTQLIENAAAAIVLAPIAYQLAVASGADPATFLLGVAICVSAAFMSPIAHESTILVMAPGRYAFKDYLKLGTGFALITWLMTLGALAVLRPL